MNVRLSHGGTKKLLFELRRVFHLRRGLADNRPERQHPPVARERGPPISRIIAEISRTLRRSFTISLSTNLARKICEICSKSHFRGFAFSAADANSSPLLAARLAQHVRQSMTLRCRGRMKEGLTRSDHRCMV